MNKARKLRKMSASERREPRGLHGEFGKGRNMSGRPKKCAGSYSGRRDERGFTLLELLIVVTIIGLLASIAIPAYSQYRERAFVASVASNLRNFGLAFDAYAIENGQYPNDSHIVLPPGAGMEQVIDVNLWLATTPVGGNYNWEGPDGYPYAGISLVGVPDSEPMVSLDKMLDDGILATGRFRLTPNGRYTYILEE